MSATLQVVAQGGTPLEIGMTCLAGACVPLCPSAPVGVVPSDIKTVQVYSHRGILYRSIQDRQRAHLRDIYELAGISADVIASVLDLTISVGAAVINRNDAVLCYQTRDGNLYSTMETAATHDRVISAPNDPVKLVVR